MRAFPDLGILAALATLAGTACSGGGWGGGTPPAADSLSVARARTAADSLGPDLMGMLTKELTVGGPESAVAICSDSAQLRTARHSRDGLTIRRVGTRVRNTKNTPDSVETRILAYMQGELDAGRPLKEFVEVGRAGAGWELRLMRPITLLPQCTACHGNEEQIPPAARALITARYPDDRAVGYAPGDLRGAISVRVAMPASR